MISPPTRDPACPESLISFVELTIEFPYLEPAAIDGYRGTLTLMENNELNQPQEIADPVAFELNKFEAEWGQTITEGRKMVIIDIRPLSLESHTRISGEYWKFTGDPRAKYADIVIGAVKITGFG